MNIRVTDQKNTLVAEKSFPPGRNRVTVGRDPDNDLVLQVPEISGKHFVIEERLGQLHVRDCDSINGVFVNHRKVKHGRVPVNEQDLVEAGGLQFRIARSTITAAGAPAAQPAAQGPSRLTIALVILVCVLVIAAVLKKAASRDAGLPPDSAATTSPTNLYAQQQAEARQVYRQAQESYFRNNLVEAATLFATVLELDPANQNARDFLEEIRFETVGGLIAVAFRNLEQNDLAGAERNVSKLQALDPSNPRVQELARLRDGQVQFEKAKLLYGQGKYDEAYSILKGIQVVNDAQRLRWLREVDTRLNFQAKFREADSNLNRGDAGIALVEFDGLAGSVDPADPWREEIQQKTAIAERVQRFERALDGSDYAQAVRQGQWLTANLSRENYALLLRKVNAQMEELRTRLQPLQGELENAARDAIQQADSKLAGDEAGAYDLYHTALGALIALDFLSPSPQRAGVMRDLNAKLSRYVRKVYQQGYILSGLGDFGGAEKCFERVAALAGADDEYHSKATDQLRRIRKPAPPAEASDS